MASKKITIVFLPDGSKKIRQFKISKSFFVFFFIFILSAASFLTWLIGDYRAVKMGVPHLTQLEKENKQQKMQLVALTQKIDQISGELIQLKKFDHKLKVMVNLETSKESPSFLGLGGSDPTVMNPDYTVEKAHRKLIRLMHQSLDNLTTEISVQTQEKAELYKFLENQKSMLACTPSIWPTRGWVSSGFGNRISPFTNEMEFHRGLDISARMNTPIISPADGVVFSIGRDRAMGRMMTVNHGYGLKTRYGHLSKVLVKKGQYVKRGQKIALLGNTGRSTGPHLHYEVHLKGIPVSPFRYILN